MDTLNALLKMAGLPNTSSQPAAGSVAPQTSQKTLPLSDPRLLPPQPRHTLTPYEQWTAVDPKWRALYAKNLGQGGLRKLTQQAAAMRYNAPHWQDVVRKSYARESLGDPYVQHTLVDPDWQRVYDPKVLQQSRAQLYHIYAGSEHPNPATQEAVRKLIERQYQQEYQQGP